MTELYPACPLGPGAGGRRITLDGLVMREPTLGTFPHPFIAVACRYCARKGRYRRDKLIQKYGAGMRLDAFVRLISADCGHAEVRTGRRGCNGPYVVPPEVRPPEVPRHCPLVKERKWF
jgi:hypothetical protein